jgi:hypothetical protein
VTANKDVTASTTESYTITLYSDGKEVTSKSVTITVVPTDNLTYTVSAPDKLYTEVAGGTPIANPDSIDLKLAAKDANGNAVTVDYSLIQKVVVDPSEITYNADKKTLVAPTAGIDTKDADATGTATVFLQTKTGTKTLTCNFTYSSKAPVADKAVLTKTSDTTVVAADTEIFVDDANKGDALHGYTLVINDQYGNPLADGTANYVVTNFKDSTGADKTLGNVSYANGKLNLGAAASALAKDDHYKVSVAYGIVSMTVPVTVNSTIASVATAYLQKESEAEVAVDDSHNTASVIEADANDALKGYKLYVKDQYGNMVNGITYSVSNYKVSGTGTAVANVSGSYTNDKLTIKGISLKASDTFDVNVTDKADFNATVKVTVTSATALYANSVVVSKGTTVFDKTIEISTTASKTDVLNGYAFKFYDQFNNEITYSSNATVTASDLKDSSSQAKSPVITSSFDGTTLSLGACADFANGDNFTVTIKTAQSPAATLATITVNVKAEA